MGMVAAETIPHQIHKMDAAVTIPHQAHKMDVDVAVAVAVTISHQLIISIKWTQPG